MRFEIEKMKIIKPKLRKNSVLISATPIIIRIPEYMYTIYKIPEKYRDHAWFAAVFPVENPKYVVVIMVEHGSSGSRGAAPIAGAIINKMVDLGYAAETDK